MRQLIHRVHCGHVRAHDMRGDPPDEIHEQRLPESPVVRDQRERHGLQRRVGVAPGGLRGQQFEGELLRERGDEGRDERREQRLLRARSVEADLGERAQGERVAHLGEHELRVPRLDCAGEELVGHLLQSLPNQWIF